MSSDSDIKITGEPSLVPAICQFGVDRPLFSGRSYFFKDSEQAKESALATRLFQIDGIRNILISHDRITVTKEGMEPWPIVGKQIGAAIREHIGSGKPAVSEQLWNRLPSAKEIRDRVERVLRDELNPALASHGGFVHLADVKDNTIFLQLGGGCQGCGMAAFTLKQGVEVAIRVAVPEVGDILDTTDHGAGENPYHAEA